MDQNEKWDAAKKAFGIFCQTISELRNPSTGCPWDLEQTHESLRKYMIEEAYEAVSVMEPVQSTQLRDELGDVLLQVVLNSQIAAESNTFKIEDVVENITKKMIRRHPHVFGVDGNLENKSSRQLDDIRETWNQIKAQERKKNFDEKSSKSASIFSRLKPGSLSPASRLAVSIGKKAREINFDWPNSLAVLNQFKSEVEELSVEIQKLSENNNSIVKKLVYEELGDVFFSLSQLCRHLEIDPEICALDGNRKFLDRFELLEKLALEAGINVRACDSSDLEALWQKAKASQISREPINDWRINRRRYLDNGWCLHWESRAWGLGCAPKMRFESEIALRP